MYAAAVGIWGDRRIATRNFSINNSPYAYALYLGMLGLLWQ